MCIRDRGCLKSRSSGAAHAQRLQSLDDTFGLEGPRRQIADPTSSLTESGRSRGALGGRGGAARDGVGQTNAGLVALCVHDIESVRRGHLLVESVEARGQFAQAGKNCTDVLMLVSRVLQAPFEGFAQHRSGIGVVRGGQGPDHHVLDVGQFLDGFLGADDDDPGRSQLGQGELGATEVLGLNDHARAELGVRLEHAGPLALIY